MNLSYSLKGTVVSDGFSTDVTVTVSGDIPPGAEFKAEAKALWTTANDELEKRVENMKKRHKHLTKMREIKEQIFSIERTKEAIRMDDLADPFDTKNRINHHELRTMRERIKDLPAKLEALAKIEADLAANE